MRISHLPDNGNRQLIVATRACSGIDEAVCHCLSSYESDSQPYEMRPGLFTGLSWIFQRQRRTSGSCSADIFRSFCRVARQGYASSTVAHKAHGPGPSDCCSTTLARCQSCVRAPVPLLRLNVKLGSISNAVTHLPCCNPYGSGSHDVLSTLYLSGVCITSCVTLTFSATANAKTGVYQRSICCSLMAAGRLLRCCT